jgi:3-hydroxyacyl-[acyl-carrier-protein] dehydratase
MRFLMVDRVRELVPDQRLVAVKNVSLDADYLEHHFPGVPIFPGVLMLEAMAQASGHLISRSIFELEQRHVFAMMISNRARYLKVVRPGDQIIMEVSLIRRDQHDASTRVVASVEGEVCARAEIGFALRGENGELEVEAMLRQANMLRRTLEGDYR